jgi:hypothetical protein
MSIKQKHVLMLTILLVHEASHLLHNAFSNFVTDHTSPNITPPVPMNMADPRPFKDMGHMMEFHLFGFVIQHLSDSILCAPFSIEEILGTAHELDKEGKIIKPSNTALLDLIDKGVPPLEIPLINADFIKFETIGSQVVQQSAFVQFGARASTGWAPDDLVSLEIGESEEGHEIEDSEDVMYYDPFDSFRT